VLDPATIKDPGLVGPILDDLAAYTGIPRARCRELSTRSPNQPHRSWVAWDPTSRPELAWYYRTTAAYVFALCDPRWCHPLDLLAGLDAEGNPPVALDVGAGIGTDALYLAQRGCLVFYSDPNHWNREFARCRYQRHRDDIPGVVNFDTDPPEVDVLIAVDVLEHIPDYPRVLREQWLPRVKRSGHFLYSAPFCRAPGLPDNVGLHVNQTEPIPDILAEAGFRCVKRIAGTPDPTGDAHWHWIRN